MERKEYSAGAVKLSFWFIEFSKVVELLHEGKNEILVFETEAVDIKSLNFSSQPVFDTLKQK